MLLVLKSINKIFSVDMRLTTSIRTCRLLNNATSSKITVKMRASSHIW